MASVERGSELGRLALQAIDLAQYSFSVRRRRISGRRFSPSKAIHNKVVVAEILG